MSHTCTGLDMCHPATGSAAQEREMSTPLMFQCNMAPDFISSPGFTFDLFLKFYYSRQGNHFIETVTHTVEEKDLGVQFTIDLKPSRQCQLAYSTASKVLGMIGRTVSYKSRYVMLRLYKSQGHIWNSASLHGHRIIG